MLPCQGGQIRDHFECVVAAGLSRVGYSVLRILSNNQVLAFMPAIGLILTVDVYNFWNKGLWLEYRCSLSRRLGWT